MIAKLVIQYRAYIPGYFLNPLSLIGKVACVHNSGSVSLFWLPEHQIRLEKKKKKSRISKTTDLQIFLYKKQLAQFT